MTARVDGDEKPETPAWTYTCALKDLLLPSLLLVVAALHSPDQPHLHHSDISVDGASSAIQWKTEGHNEELDRRDAALRCA